MKIEDILSMVLNLFGVTLLPVAIPWLIYLCWIGRLKKKSLPGKVVLITGASSGLGESLAAVFYWSGCKVILSARRISELNRVRDKLVASRPSEDAKGLNSPAVLELDLAQVRSLESKAVEAESFFGPIDILINNAGVSYRGKVLDTSVEVHMNVMNVNYFGQVALTRALLPKLMERRGHVVFVGSVQAKIAIPYRSAYAASKHALQAFADILRAEICHTGVKVTTVNPGYIKTNLSLNALTGTGDKYGVNDTTTESGFDPEYVASKVLAAVVREQSEVTVSTLTPKLAMLLRALLPSVYFHIMARRAVKT